MKRAIGLDPVFGSVIAAISDVEKEKRLQHIKKV